MLKFTKFKKIIGVSFLMLPLIATSFFMGQTAGANPSYAAAASELPTDGTVMEAVAGNYEYIVGEDGNLNVTLTSGYGGNGGDGGYSGTGYGSGNDGVPGSHGSTGAPHGNGGNADSGGRGSTGSNGGRGGNGGGGTGLVIKLDGKALLAANGGNGGSGGSGGYCNYSGTTRNPGDRGGAGQDGITKTLSIAVKKGQIVLIEQLIASGASGGSTPGGSGGTAIKAAWSFTLQTSKKILTESDSFEALSRQATAMERMATAFEKMVSGGAIGGGNTSSGTPMVSVVGSKAFNIYVTGEKNSVGTWKSGNVTLINNDLNDNYLQVVGIISDIGHKEILLDGIKYIFNVIQEPDSSNVNVILN